MTIEQQALNVIPAPETTTPQQKAAELRRVLQSAKGVLGQGEQYMAFAVQATNLIYGA